MAGATSLSVLCLTQPVRMVLGVNCRYFEGKLLRTLTIRQSKGSVVPKSVSGVKFLISPKIVSEWFVNVLGMLEDSRSNFGTTSRRFVRVEEV